VLLAGTFFQIWKNLFQIHEPLFEIDKKCFQIGDFSPSFCKTAGVKYALKEQTLRHFDPAKARGIGDVSVGVGISKPPVG
jgi:hypothetical protein